MLLWSVGPPMRSSFSPFSCHSSRSFQKFLQCETCDAGCTFRKTCDRAVGNRTDANRREPTRTDLHRCQAPPSCLCRASEAWLLLCLDGDDRAFSPARDQGCKTSLRVIKCLNHSCQFHWWLWWGISKRPVRVRRVFLFWGFGVSKTVELDSRLLSLIQVDSDEWLTFLLQFPQSRPGLQSNRYVRVPAYADGTCSGQILVATVSLCIYHEELEGILLRLHCFCLAQHADFFSYVLTSKDEVASCVHDSDCHGLNWLAALESGSTPQGWWDVIWPTRRRSYHDEVHGMTEMWRWGRWNTERQSLTLFALEKIYFSAFSLCILNG